MFQKSLMAVALVFSSACGTMITVKRNQPSIYTLKQDRRGVGLLDVSVDDDILARAPNDFSNMTGLIAKAIKDYIDPQGFPFAHYTDLAFKATWKNPTSYGRTQDTLPTLAPLEGIPVGVQTPLVTVVKVLDWRTYKEADATLKDVQRDTASVRLLLSTWSREGHLVSTQEVHAVAKASTSHVELKAGSDNLVTWFRASDGKEYRLLPAKREELFMMAVQEAVAIHYYPYFPHTVVQKYFMADDSVLKPGIEAAQLGKYDEALALWRQVAEKEPKSHGALFNAAIMQMAKGNDEQALELLDKACAIDEKYIYRVVKHELAERVQMRKVITPTGVEPPPKAPAVL